MIGPAIASIFKWLFSNRFVIGIALAIGLAWVLPDWGRRGGFLFSEYTIRAGIFTILLLQGLVLPTGELLHGMRQWKVHLFIQSLVFILPPILFALALLPLWAILPRDLLIGFAFLAFLPSTIATAVIYTIKAGGSFPIALCNTTLSNIGGILLIPAVFTWVAMKAGGGVSTLRLYLEVIGLLLFPLALGQTLRANRAGLRAWMTSHKKWAGTINSGIILYIVFCIFSQSVADNAWSSHTSRMLLAVAIFTVFLLLALRLAVFACLAASSFNTAERTAAFFCGSQKTFGVGVPLAQSIFAYGEFNLALILLPLMIYHPMQIILDGVIANKLASRNLP